MKLLPIERYRLLTKLSPEEIKKLLEANVAPKSRGLQIKIGWNKPASGKPYEGVVKSNSFEISRIIDYRNSFLPVITGDVSHEIVHTVVKIKMTLSIVVAVFMTLWMGGVVVGLVGCVIAIINGILSGSKFEPMLLIPFGMLIFGYLLVTLAFQNEASKSRKFLQDLLKGWEEGKA
ncbi:hypothetical protein HHL17_19935 [Chitinophaga sp. G-6-1-13]|uniref:Uncharacterized protein n=1 Tax=Chitinophaga fulva TaxID=2728842 RepID=A0A848GR05_9BACT|nr:hypothetical protein [Chitinophaga fulva]NML39482.1 hypothetical protein [Chitinophaga fulva]